MANLEERIEEILAGIYTTGHDQVQATQAYSEYFQHEGLRKAQFVINRINELDAPTRNSLKDFTALSVGGADGSDLLALVKNTPVRRAILLEQDNVAAEWATEHTKPLIEAEGGTLRVIVGDAVQKLEPIVELLKADQKSGASGLLGVFFAVLHELPRRSVGFELRTYVARLASVFGRNLFFLSEPYLPPQKQEEVEVRVSRIDEDRLYELLKHINAHLFNNSQSIHKLSDGFVRAGFPLVMEMLHKLLRFETIPRLRHEMAERLTQFSSDQFVQALQITLPRAIVERTERVSEGFERAYRSAEVELRTIDGQQLLLPFSHVRVSAISLPPLLGTAKQGQAQKKKTVQAPGKPQLAKTSKFSEEFRYADSSLADVDFPMPSGHPVTQIILALRSYDWYKQSPAIEKVFTKLEWSQVTHDEAFVLGRNIYQCADGDENRAKDIMNDLRRALAKIPDDWSVHIANGMFYEAYFNHEGKFRDGKLKDKHLAKLFGIETSSKFERCIEFIRAALEPYRDRLGILPNAIPERLKVKVKLNIDEDPPVIASIKCRGVEQMVPVSDDAADPAWELSYRPVPLERFEGKLTKFWNIPEGRLDVSFDKDVSEIERIQIPQGKTVRRLRM